MDLKYKQMSIQIKSSYANFGSDRGQKVRQIYLRLENFGQEIFELFFQQLEWLMSIWKSWIQKKRGRPKIISFFAKKSQYFVILQLYQMKVTKKQTQQQLMRSIQRRSYSPKNFERFRQSSKGQSYFPFLTKRNQLLQRVRSTFDPEAVSLFLLELQRQQHLQERNNIQKIKQTLSFLSDRLKRASSSLSISQKFLYDVDLEGELENCEGMEQESTTTKSSLGLQKQMIKTVSKKQKGYYLEHIEDALRGRNQRAAEHIELSHIVFRRYSRLQSPSFAYLANRRINLPQSEADKVKKTLVLDLDETIIHCDQSPINPYDISIPIEIADDSYVTAYIKIRPFALSFIKKMSKLYQIIAFTASHKTYANAILDQLDFQGKYIKHRLYHDSCIHIEDGIYAKDLRIINRQLSSIVLLYNAPYSYLFQPENAIPILPFKQGEDNQLLRLQSYLLELSRATDVREMNKRRFRLHEYAHWMDWQGLAEGLSSC